MKKLLWFALCLSLILPSAATARYKAIPDLAITGLSNPNWVDVRRFSDIENALNALVDTKARLRITKDVTLNSSLTAGSHAGITLEIAANKTIIISNAATYDFNLSVEPGGQVIISADITLSGNLKLGNSATIPVVGSLGTETLTLTGNIDIGAYTGFDNLLFAGTPNYRGPPTVPTIAALRLVTGNYGQTINVSGYHTEDDGNGGPERYYAVGQAAGFYIDDGGSIIIPTGGDGSEAWLFRPSAVVNAASFGMKNDAAFDNSSALDSAVAYIKAFITKLTIDAPIDPSFLYAAPKLVIPAGAYGLSTSFVIEPSFSVDMEGVRLVALTDGMTLVRSATSVETIADFGKYGSNSTYINGGIADGNNKASIGFQFDTIAQDCAFRNQTAMRCTYSRYATTGSITVDTTALTLASATDVNVLDTITIAGIEEELMIVSISGLVATVSNAVSATVSNAVVTHRAAGMSLHMVQQSSIDGFESVDNDIGLVAGINRDGLQCTDLDFKGGLVRENEQGCVLINISGSTFLAPTFQHSKSREELTMVQGNGVTFIEPYIESLSTAHFEAIETGRAAVMSTIPMVNILEATAAARLMHIRWPTNATSTPFRRLIANEGRRTWVGGVSTQTEALNVNPNRAGDYAFIEQDSSLGEITMIQASNQTTLTRPEDFIIDESGTYMPTSRSHSVFYVSGTRLSAGGNNGFYGANAASSAQRIYITGDTQPRIDLVPTKISFGSGSATVDADLRRVGANVLGAGVGDSFYVEGEWDTGLLRLGSYHLWVDSTGNLRIDSTTPTSDTAGTVVGTQTP